VTNGWTNGWMNGQVENIMPVRPGGDIKISDYEQLIQFESQ